MNRIENVYALTPAQEGIYAQYYRDRETVSYRLCYLFELRDGTDTDVLRQALDLLPLRHPVLKTAFAVVEGSVKQVILSDRKIRYQTVSFDADQSLQALEDAVEAEKAEPFDLQKDPLARCTLFLFRDKRYLFFQTHHLIVDGWCASVLFGDLLRDYRALADGAAPDEIRAELAKNGADGSFASFVSLLRRQDPAPARAYWEDLLKGVKPSALPPRRDRTDAPALRREVASISAADLQKAESFARAHGITLNTLLECAFALALQKHTGSRDVLFDKVISGRSLAPSRFTRTVGMMINTVPVRALRTDGQTPLGFLASMNDQSAAADKYGILSLSDVCRQSGVDPASVEALFDFGNYPTPADGGDLPLVLRELSEQTEFPLTFLLSPDRQGLRILSMTDETKLSPSVVRALTDSFACILNRFAAMSDDELQDASAFSALSALTPAERELLLDRFATGPVMPIPETSVYALFEEQAENDPDSVRITDGERTYTFADLRTAAEKTDAFVRTRVGDRKQVIGVLCDRSFEELAAIWGVVRGGNTYLPLSPDFPPERIRLLLEQADCALVLAQEKYLSLTEKAASIEGVLASSLSENTPTPAAQPDDPLYVIFTSGSTGVPKGAMVTNRSIVNRVGWMADRYFDKDTVVMLKTPYTFDVSVWEIFGFAMRGFNLHILPPGGHYSMAATLDEIEKGRVTDLHFVPTVFASFTEFLAAHPEEKNKLNTLKNMFLSGEALRAAQVNAFYALAPEGVKIRNLYGPAECAVDVTYYDCEPGITDPVPIGRPIDNTRIHVLDEYLQPAPIGVTDQICIAGSNVGLGYLGKPELTKERFIDDPFGEGKMYLTGDLGYWREDGQLVFVGRNDNQVKLNGQRIEPGEIEAAMNAVPGVTNAAVLLLRGPDRLAAFHTGEAGADEVRAALKRTLPLHMVPQAITRLEEMPVNASGKTDRAALETLPATDETRAFAPPETDTEKAVCEAFSRVLGAQNVGRDDGFYELGGTSLQLVRLLSAPPLDRLTLSAFMADPTPAGLAKRLDGTGETDYTVLVPLFTPENAKRAVVLFPYAGGDASAYTALTAAAREQNAGIALYAAEWPTDEGFGPLEEEIRSLARDREVFFYSHCAGSAVAMALLDRLNADAPAVRRYIAGGSIPESGLLNVWKHLPDSAIRTVLQRAGLSADGVTLTRERLALFRVHTEVCHRYFRKKTQKTNVGVTVVLSKNDPLTANFSEAGTRWEKVAADVERVILLDAPTHYFQNTEVKLLLELFAET